MFAIITLVAALNVLPPPAALDTAGGPPRAASTAVFNRIHFGRIHWPKGRALSLVAAQIIDAFVTSRTTGSTHVYRDLFGQRNYQLAEWPAETNMLIRPELSRHASVLTIFVTMVGSDFVATRVAHFVSSAAADDTQRYLTAAHLYGAWTWRRTGKKLREKDAQYSTCHGLIAQGYSFGWSMPDGHGGTGYAVVNYPPGDPRRPLPSFCQSFASQPITTTYPTPPPGATVSH